MSTGTWEPQADKNFLDPSEANLTSFINMASNENLEQNINDISPEDMTRLQQLIKQPREFWFKVGEQHSEEELLSLIKFFTLAEAQHASLSCGNDSPVIGINKYLKSQKIFLSKDLLMWIKQNSTNKFLPNGSIL